MLGSLSSQPSSISLIDSVRLGFLLNHACYTHQILWLLLLPEKMLSKLLAVSGADGQFREV